MYRFINLKHHHYYCFTTRIFISLFILFSLLNGHLILIFFSPRYFLTLCIVIFFKKYIFFLFSDVSMSRRIEEKVQFNAAIKRDLFNKKCKKDWQKRKGRNSENSKSRWRLSLWSRLQWTFRYWFLIFSLFHWWHQFY